MGKVRKWRVKNISKTLLELYLKCPRAWYYYNHPDIPKKTDYARLCGIAVHNHIKQLYRPTATVRPFFFQSKKSAIGAWFNRWKRELDKALELNLLDPDEKLAEEYGKVGAICVANYWNANINLPRPIELEKRYQVLMDNGFALKGIFDQLRIVPLEWIAGHRPNLIENDNGVLKENYAPVVIIDLKTDIHSYDLKRDGEDDASKEKKAKQQFSLHEDLQATLYSYLYETVTGKKPVGFLWYHLRSGKMFFTYRDERDYQTLFGIINHYTEGIACESFPKHVTGKCKFCDYVEVCRGDRNFFVSFSEEFSENLEGLEILPNLVRKKHFKQLRLKLKVERRKVQTPVKFLPEAKTAQRIITLPDLPWDDDNQQKERRNQND